MKRFIATFEKIAFTIFLFLYFAGIDLNYYETDDLEYQTVRTCCFISRIKIRNINGPLKGFKATRQSEINKWLNGGGIAPERVYISPITSNLENQRFVKLIEEVGSFIGKRPRDFRVTLLSGFNAAIQSKFDNNGYSSMRVNLPSPMTLALNNEELAISEVGFSSELPSGFNAIQLSKLGKLFRGTQKRIGKMLKVGTNTKKIPLVTIKILENEGLAKSIEKVGSSRELSKQINEFVALTKPSESAAKAIERMYIDANYLNIHNPAAEGVKTIRCYRTDADKMRMMLLDANNSIRVDRIIRVSNELIRLAEYDIHSMTETFYKGQDGVEYVLFRIPKKAEHVLGNQESKRVYECMSFTLPKDETGNWKRIKTFLIDLFSHPGTLWDEYLFRKKLSKLGLKKEHVIELEEYMIARNLIEDRYEYNQCVQEEVA